MSTFSEIFYVDIFRKISDLRYAKNAATCGEFKILYFKKLFFSDLRNSDLQCRHDI